MNKKSIYKQLMMELNEAPITSPSQKPFSSPEAQHMVEKDIKKMSKILGKASQQSIKTMMDGVKGKRYDAFDIQRAIMVGNIRDTHTGERDFLRVLWNKVRDGFRRYSKRGKLRQFIFIVVDNIISIKILTNIIFKGEQKWQQEQEVVYKRV